MKNSAQLVKEWLKAKAVWFSYSFLLSLSACLSLSLLSFSFCFAFLFLFSLSISLSLSLSLSLFVIRAYSFSRMVKRPYCSSLTNGNGLWFCHDSNSVTIGHWAALCGQHLPFAWLQLQTFCSQRPCDHSGWTCLWPMTWKGLNSYGEVVAL